MFAEFDENMDKIWASIKNFIYFENWLSIKEY